MERLSDTFTQEQCFLCYQTLCTKHTEHIEHTHCPQCTAIICDTCFASYAKPASNWKCPQCRSNFDLYSRTLIPVPLPVPVPIQVPVFAMFQQGPHHSIANNPWIRRMFAMTRSTFVMTFDPLTNVLDVDFGNGYHRMTIDVNYIVEDGSD